MKRKEIEPDDAFDMVSRRHGQQVIAPGQAQATEDRYGKKKSGQPKWLRAVTAGAGVIVIFLLIWGIMLFYWFITNEATTDRSLTISEEPKLRVFNDEAKKSIIEANLRSFLEADNNEDRLSYVFDAEHEKKSLDIYYNQYKASDTPLWKIERMEPLSNANGEIWFVVYLDINKRQHAVSFQRQGEDFLLHWSAMKAFGEMPWKQFIVQRPAEPVVMRCYIRHYTGVWPVGISSKHFQCFLIEDKAGLLSEMAVMPADATGYGILKGLAKEGRHPVTVKLCYRTIPESLGEKRIVIDSLQHLRWQRMNTDAYFQ